MTNEVLNLMDSVSNLVDEQKTENTHICLSLNFERERHRFFIQFLNPKAG